ncbi:altronate hydrolase [Maricaulis sp. W15]|uniref:UxaA family hydrolase n=1 Tax=Maricaulis sp. W15 TaxID=1772333 RepID=UPI0009488DAB|nr:altronate dehydratase family protein [Maricaulis sp. W15]OLF71022.1 altronate hydrolase [Maricaulis sp. W15]
MSVAEKSAVSQGLVVHPDDRVGVATSALARGERPAANLPRLLDPVPAGHKFALTDIPAGAPVIKYGAIIGRARCDIAAGAHVHSHNLETTLSGEQDYAWTGRTADRSSKAAVSTDTFMGYRRFDGRVGIRNEIWVIATVGCVNRTSERIARMAANQVRGQVDGVHAITHPFGCSQLGDDLEKTRAILAGLAQNPNAGGVLLVGLGCESNQYRALLDAMPDTDPLRVRAFACQEAGDELDAGIAAVAEIADHMAQMDRREPCPVSDLVIGLKCGGSDAFSGLTANPLLGRITDRLDAAGGSTILTEVPEMFGAEHILMDRAVSREVHTAIGTMMNRFKRYFIGHGEPVHANPSPGNIEGGITTLEEKSLGGVQKAGSAPVVDVLDYGDRLRRSGLSLLEAPGNDAVSTTAMAAAGATMILFTTGRGTPLGTMVPTLKLSTRSDLAERKPNWIDFDAGPILDGEAPDATADRLWRTLLDVAGGKRARNELYDERQIALWKGGVTL